MCACLSSTAFRGVLHSERGPDDRPHSTPHRPELAYPGDVSFGVTRRRQPEYGEEERSGQREDRQHHKAVMNGESPRTTRRNWGCATAQGSGLCLMSRTGGRILATMTVGEYAGVPLQNSDDTWRHGAVFLLRKSAARRSTTVLLPNGWLVSVVDRTNVVVVCGPSVATSFDDTFAEALEAANHALDFWSIGGESDHAIREAPDDCLVWWPDPECGGTVMRCKVVINVSPRLSMTGHVTDADGNVPPPPPPPPPPTAVTHDAFRFVRMSRTSTDLFDAYRNLFWPSKYCSVRSVLDRGSRAESGCGSG